MIRSDAFLYRRIRALTLFFIAALVVSGLTAIPLETEMDTLVAWAKANPHVMLDDWLVRVQSGVHDVNQRWPFMGLGTDWLAFGHIVIAMGFIGLLRDPIRNEWLITWGIMACVLVIPWAWTFGTVRDIPWGWRLIDCSFGVLGLIPIFMIRRDVNELKRREARNR